MEQFIGEEQLIKQMQIDKLPKPDYGFAKFLVNLIGSLVGCWLLVETGFKIGRWWLSL